MLDINDLIAYLHLLAVSKPVESFSLAQRTVSFSLGRRRDGGRPHSARRRSRAARRENPRGFCPGTPLPRSAMSCARGGGAAERPHSAGHPAQTARGARGVARGPAVRARSGSVGRQGAGGDVPAGDSRSGRAGRRRPAPSADSHQGRLSPALVTLSSSRPWKFRLWSDPLTARASSPFSCFQSLRHESA